MPRNRSIRPAMTLAYALRVLPLLWLVRYLSVEMAFAEPETGTGDLSTLLGGTYPSSLIKGHLGPL